ncbi:MAG: serine/threonine-protein phosphatase [Deltaproteobacteria bacterium]|nr:serine/threonine-protein phosphatase [Deltaproteobacteria bacterium]
MNVKSIGKTDIGLKRKKNEDSYFLAPDLGLYLVADGIGGHKSGEVASKMVAQIIGDYWAELKKAKNNGLTKDIEKNLSVKEHLINSISFANEGVYEAQKVPEHRGMGSTVAVLFFEGRVVWAANVGDSRIYKFDSGGLLQVSEEHSLEAEQRGLGLREIDNQANTSFKHILTRALGAKDKVDIFITSLEPKVGDMLLLCSDGLTNFVDEKAITEVLDDFTVSLGRKVDILIDEAKRGGGYDNITVILLEVAEEKKKSTWFGHLRP